MRQGTRKDVRAPVEGVARLEGLAVAISIGLPRWLTGTGYSARYPFGLVL